MASNDVVESPIEEKRSPDDNIEKTSTHSTAVTSQTPPNNGHVSVEGAKAEFEALRRSLSRASSLHRVQSGQKDLEAPDDDDFDLLDYLVCPRSTSIASALLTSIFLSSALPPHKTSKQESRPSTLAYTGKTSKSLVEVALKSTSDDSPMP